VADLDRVYASRFEDPDVSAKDKVWVEIAHYLQRFVDAGAPVLDMACDRGYFIRNIETGEKWASDVRDVSDSLPKEVHFVQANGLTLGTSIPNAHFGTVFMSNYLEHLASGEQVIEQLRVAFDLLRPGGRVVILQPNIRLVGPAYWDFIDHKVALTERSLLEAATVVGFETERVIVRFLPYTTKSRLVPNPLLVRLYLRMPFFWRFFAGQTLYVGRRS
jgi:SAM-dependent methyltransferase